MKQDLQISVVVLVGPSIHKTLDQCVRAIMGSAGVRFEVILVANAAKSGGHQKLQKSYPGTRVLYMGENRGIAGYNEGVRKARAPLVLLLDEDCVVEPDILSRFVRAFERSPAAVGAVAGNVYNTGQKQYFYRKIPCLGKSLATFPGGATAFKKDVFVKVGLFDEDMFLWLHEDDLAVRMLERGFTIEFDESIIVRHFDVEERLRPFQAKLIFRNKAWLDLKYFSLYWLPILMVRDVIWMISYALYKQSITAFGLTLMGYLWGFMSAATALSKRRVLSRRLQLSLLKFYFTYRNA